MGILKDILIITVIILFLIALVYAFLNREAERLERKTHFTYSELRAGVLKMINDYISVNVTGMGLTNQAVEKQENQRRSVARSVRNCNSGNTGSKIVVKDLIYSYLVNLGIDNGTINHVIPFDQPKLMTGRQLMETMVFMRDKDGDSGFLSLHNEYDFIRPVDEADGTCRYEVSETDIRDMYTKERYRLSVQDKLNVLTQLLYADTHGLGVIDTLNYQKGCVEEIQLGMAGLPQQIYNYRTELDEKNGNVRLFHSKDAVHILIHGVNIWLPFLGFESDSEMQRVLRNLIKDSSAGELTIETPEAVVDAADGRRISVARPPVADGWCGLVRKFDTLMVTDLDAMYYKKHGSDAVNEVIRNLVRSGRNIAITGEMSAGKTSMFRTVMKETRPDLSIRVIEGGSFELNIRRCLPIRNSLALRVTDHIKEEEVLSFVRKTTGQIFCVGEVNSHAMANLAMDLAKIAQQSFFSAHYISTEAMVQDFVASKISVGGFSDEKLAEMDAVSSLGFDIHIRMVRGERYVQYINEVVPQFDFDAGYDTGAVSEDSALVKTAEAIREVRKQLGKARTYKIRKILEYDEEAKVYKFYNRPSKECYEKAQWYMTPKQFTDFCDLFEILVDEEVGEKVG